VQFDSYGGIDVLEVRDVPRPVPAASEVLVEVRAAGINPSEAVIRSGALHHLFPATFPSGQGSDLAGVVAELGPGVSGFAVGDEVIDVLLNDYSDADRWLTRSVEGDPKDSESWLVQRDNFQIGGIRIMVLGALRVFCEGGLSLLLFKKNIAEQEMTDCRIRIFVEVLPDGEVRILQQSFLQKFSRPLKQRIRLLTRGSLARCILRLTRADFVTHRGPGEDESGRRPTNREPAGCESEKATPGFGQFRTQRNRLWTDRDRSMQSNA
jgi:hypothetical protein